MGRSKSPAECSKASGSPSPVDKESGLDMSKTASSACKTEFLTTFDDFGHSLVPKEGADMRATAIQENSNINLSASSHTSIIHVTSGLLQPAKNDIDTTSQTRPSPKMGTNAAVLNTVSGYPSNQYTERINSTDSTGPTNQPPGLDIAQKLPRLEHARIHGVDEPQPNQASSSQLQTSLLVPGQQGFEPADAPNKPKPKPENEVQFLRGIKDTVHSGNELPVFHEDNIIDPELAAYMSDDSSGDEQMNIFDTVLNTDASGSQVLTGETPGFALSLRAWRKHPSRDKSISGKSVSASFIGSELSRQETSPSKSPKFSNKVVSEPDSGKTEGKRANSHQNSETFHSETTKPTIHTLVKRTRTSGFKLNAVYSSHIDKLLQRLLQDADIPDIPAWVKALLPTILECVEKVMPDIKGGDHMDIRHYVKLKKIPGGKPTDSSFINGFIFSKKLALKSMSRRVRKPRIMLVSFPIEYPADQQDIMSLQYIIDKGQEYLRTMTNRIIELEPQVLLVEKNVSGIALEGLSAANIAVICNVKSSVIQAMSRCAEADIISSPDDLMLPVRLGSCEEFEVRSYLDDDCPSRKNSYIFMSGCNPSLGGTILLRGGPRRMIGIIKRIVDFMVCVVYHLKLESDLLQDEHYNILSNTGDNHSLPSTDEIKTPIDNGTAHGDTQAPIVGNMLAAYEAKSLTSSPFVAFVPPYLLRRLKEMEHHLADLRRLRDDVRVKTEDSIEETVSQSFRLIDPDMIHATNRPVSRQISEIIRTIHDSEYNKALQIYQTYNLQVENYIHGYPDIMSPYSHQDITLLYSVTCSETKIPCIEPGLMVIAFYDQQQMNTGMTADCTLGQYLEALWYDRDEICTAHGCDKPFRQHHRTYVHSESCVTVSLNSLPTESVDSLYGLITMWSCCKVCDKKSPPVAMSDNSWKYSFGKYLELLFWGDNLQLDSDLKCQHTKSYERIRFFSFHNTVVCIQHDRISPLEVIIPSVQITWNVKRDLALKNEVFIKTKERWDQFIASVKSRLEGIRIDAISPEQIEACKSEIERLLNKTDEDHRFLTHKLQGIYVRSKYYETLPFNNIVREMTRGAVSWDEAFVNFESEFLPSKDLSRFPLLQFKNGFIGKSLNHSQSENDSVPPDIDSQYIPVRTSIDQGQQSEMSQLAKNLEQISIENLNLHIDSHNGRTDGLHSQQTRTKLPESLTKPIAEVYEGVKEAAQEESSRYDENRKNCKVVTLNTSLIGKGASESSGASANFSCRYILQAPDCWH